MSDKLEATDENITLLQNQLNDAKAQISERDLLLAEKDTEIADRDKQIVKYKQIEKEYNACMMKLKDRAVAYYAAIRRVDVNNESDNHFVRRKIAIMGSTSMAYILASMEQYQDDLHERSQESKELADVNDAHFDF